MVGALTGGSAPEATHRADLAERMAARAGIPKIRASAYTRIVVDALGPGMTVGDLRSAAVPCAAPGAVVLR